MLPLISIIVPNYEGKEVFPNCIRSLLKQDYPRLQIILVDDSSTDGSVDLARKMFGAEITIIQTPKNSGYVGACNYALRFCKGTYVVVTNNDATFPKNWVSELYSIVDGKKKTIGASLVVHPWEKEGYKKVGTEIFSVWALTGIGRVLRRLTPEEQKSGFFEMHAAGVLIIPRNALTSYIFAKEYFAYGEDVELCWRLRLQGYNVVINKHAKMRHLGSFTRQKVPSFNKRAIINGAKNNIMNFLIFYEFKNFIRILPIFLLLEATVFLARPRQIPYRIKAYWWILTHLLLIAKRRKKYQRSRKVSDEEILRLMTYKIDDEFFAANRIHKFIIRFSNFMLRHYYRLVGIRTFDLYDDNATPKINTVAVRRRTQKNR